LNALGAYTEADQSVKVYCSLEGLEFDPSYKKGPANIDTISAPDPFLQLGPSIADTCALEGSSAATMVTSRQNMNRIQICPTFVTQLIFMDHQTWQQALEDTTFDPSKQGDETSAMNNPFLDSTLLHEFTHTLVYGVYVKKFQA
jgi:hypothetical protein